MGEGRGAGSQLETIAVVQEELLLWAWYYQGSEEKLEIDGVHVVQLELVEIGNWLIMGSKQERGIKIDFSAFYYLRLSNSTFSLRVPVPLG